MQQRLCQGQFKVQMHKNFLRKGYLGKTGTKFSYKDSRLHGRFHYIHETTELQICQGGLESDGHSWERGGHSRGPFCDCYLAVSRSPFLGVSLAHNWAAMTRHTYARRCFMPHYESLGPSNLLSSSLLPQLRGTSRLKSQRQISAST